MRSILFLLFGGMAMGYACHQPSRSAEKSVTVASETDTASNNKLFFPVVDYIGGELKIIDSLQLPITKTIITNHTEKVFPLTTAELHELAAAFMEPDINAPANKPFYQEESVADKSVPSVNFMYTTTNASLPIRRLDVTIKPDPVLSDKVNSIYIEKTTTVADTLITKRLFWKAKKNFQITTEKKWGNTLFPRETIKVIWDPS
jgi:hypothetical protein